MAGDFVLCLVLTGILSAIPAVGPVPLADGDDLESAKEEIRVRIERGEFKEARKALKIFKRQYGKEADGKAGWETLSRLLDGSEELQKITEAFRKKGRPRTTAEKLQVLLQEYGDLADLAQRVRDTLEAVRGEYVLILEDFETWKTEETREGGVVIRKEISKGMDVEIISDATFVKHGKHACRWTPGDSLSSFSFEPPEADLSEYAFLCAWIFNEQRGRRLGKMRFEAKSAEGGVFTYSLTIDWTGWKEIRVPLSGGPFSRIGNPDWATVETFIVHHDLHAGALKVVIDDIRAEKKAQ